MNSSPVKQEEGEDSGPQLASRRGVRVLLSPADIFTRTNATTVTLPQIQAAASTFPPGCPVVYYLEAPEFCRDAVVGMGTVQSVSIDIASSSRELMHDIKAHGSSLSTIVGGEMDLRYAPKCPVFVENDGVVAGKSRDEGIILFGTPRTDGASGASYSLLVKLGEERFVEKHGISSDRIKFRPGLEALSLPPPPIAPPPPPPLSQTAPVSVAVPEQSIGKASHTTESNTRPKSNLNEEPPMKKLKWTSPRSKEAAAVSSPPKRDASFNSSSSSNLPLDIDAPLGSSRNVRSELAMMKSAGNYRRIDIPSWLDRLNQREVMLHVIGKGGGRVRNIGSRFRCQIQVRGKGANSTKDRSYENDTLHVSIRGSGSSSAVNEAKSAIEDLILDFAGADLAKGRLLYDFAASDNTKQGARRFAGAVYQRNPYHLTERVWMRLVELPSTEDGNYHSRAYLLGRGGDIVREIREKSGAKMSLVDNSSLCDPFVLLYADDKNSVIRAVSIVQGKIREHQRDCSCLLPFEK